LLFIYIKKEIVVMRMFIAGIMQGSRSDGEIEGQDYRREIAQIARQYIPDIDVLDPFELHPDSVDYSPEQARRTFLELVELAGRVDVLVAYAPSASMGTAIEMWNAYQSGVRIYTISQMTDNWVVQSLSERVFPDVAAFAAFVADGGLDRDVPLG